MRASKRGMLFAYKPRKSAPFKIKTHHKILSCDCSLHPTNGVPVPQNAYSSMVDKKREPQKKESKKGKRRKKQKVENNQDGHGHAR